MKARSLRTSLLLTAVSLLVLLAAMSAATYAWFTFDPYTNVAPWEGKISDGDVNLLISESASGPFGKRCTLHPAVFPDALHPISTADLSRFYAATTQDKEGYSIAFRDVTEKSADYLISGTVYLQCLGSDCAVYLWKSTLNTGSDPQFLAAGRLALRITGKYGTNTYFFKLDSLGSTATAESRQTIHAENAVVGGLNGKEAVFANDPALTLDRYAIESEPRIPVCTMEPEEIATVEYWLYLEGCDPECFNPVQSRDLALQLGFAGEKLEPDE